MGKPAARLTDMHTCPLANGPVPHVGGPITAPGCPTVLIGGLPAARVSDMAVCVGPPDVIAMGSPTVLIGGLMAARMGDPTVHGGVIVLGCPTVLIGEVGMGSPDAPSMGAAAAPTGGEATMSETAQAGQVDTAHAGRSEYAEAGVLEDSKRTASDKPWDVNCILEIFCKGDSEDKEVVKKLPKLTINKREAKQVHYKKYEGGKWVDGGFTSGGSANGRTVWVNHDTNCREAAATFYHEVIHTDQPDTMPASQKEYAAYLKEEQWRIKKGYPLGGRNYRKKIKDPKDASKTIEVPNEGAIRGDVDANYAYNPPTPAGGGTPPPSVLGLTSDGKQVRLSDGTTRPPKEGDAYRLPDTGGRILETIDPAKWKCP